uniref:Uncharacterized protein n=1 Tax=Glossina brevipalpis TaxID=37001 RepID=A0A1A9WHL9_9MUSC
MVLFRLTNNRILAKAKQNTKGPAISVSSILNILVLSIYLLYLLTKAAHYRNHQQFHRSRPIVTVSNLDTFYHNTNSAEIVRGVPQLSALSCETITPVNEASNERALQQFNC